MKEPKWFKNLKAKAKARINEEFCKERRTQKKTLRRKWRERCKITRRNNKVKK